MDTAPNMPSTPQQAGGPHPLRTIREIRDSLPTDQVTHFDSELADTDINALPAMLQRWATFGNDGFVEFLLSTPFDGLEFGGRSYDDAAGEA